MNRSNAHYSALIKDKDQWITYDGMVNPPIKNINDSPFVPDGWKATYCLYGEKLIDISIALDSKTNYCNRSLFRISVLQKSSSPDESKAKERGGYCYYHKETIFSFYLRIFSNLTPLLFLFVKALHTNETNEITNPSQSDTSGSISDSKLDACNILCFFSIYSI